MRLLIVRTQNRERIVASNDFRMSGRENNTYSVDAVHQSGGISIVGTYSTYEKAMKVMDMIQWHFDEGVFEAPLDDEVEELYSSCRVVFD